MASVHRTDPDTTLPDRADVVVVGGGVTGLTAAGALARHGSDVLLVEAETIGAGASGASLGVLSSDYPGGPNDVLQRLGPGVTTHLWLAAAESQEMLAELTEVRPVVMHTAAVGRRQRELLAADALWLERRGFPVRLVELNGRVVTADASAAVVDPHRLIADLARAITSSGGAIVDGVAVLGVSRHTGGYQVLTTAGKVSARSVVVATNAPQRRGALGGAPPMVWPSEGFAWEAAGAADITAAMGEAAVVRSLGGLTIRLTDEQVLVGGTQGLVPGTDPARAAKTLRRMAARLVEPLGGVDIERAWSAGVSLSGDGVPHIWRVDGVWHAGGYNGHGLVAAAAVGTQLGELIAGVRSHSVYADARPPPRRIRRRASKVRALLDRRLGF